jgi:hypothetical protein
MNAKDTEDTEDGEENEHNEKDPDNSYKNCSTLFTNLHLACSV